MAACCGCGTGAAAGASNVEAVVGAPARGDISLAAAPGPPLLPAALASARACAFSRADIGPRFFSAASGSSAPLPLAGIAAAAEASYQRRCSYLSRTHASITWAGAPFEGRLAATSGPASYMAAARALPTRLSRSTSSGSHASRLTTFTRVTWAPTDRCIAKQLLHRNTPSLTDAYRGICVPQSAQHWFAGRRRRFPSLARSCFCVRGSFLSCVSLNGIHSGCLGPPRVQRGGGQRVAARF
eukprot:COSAG05_NODE_5854_length_1072_cov_10.225077_1_plen_241_part_00